MPIAIQWFSSKPIGNEYLIYALPIWRQDVKRADIKEKDLKDWLNLQLDVELKKGFIEIKKVDFAEIVVAFNSGKWLKENFEKLPLVQFYAPRTLEWTFKRRLPDVLTAHAQWNTIKKFIEDKFKYFLKERGSSIFKDKMRLLKKVNYDWFEYDADLQMNKITTRVKPSVLITLLIGANVARKIFTTPDPWRTDER